MSHSFFGEAFRALLRVLQLLGRQAPVSVHTLGITVRLIGTETDSLLPYLFVAIQLNLLVATSCTAVVTVILRLLLVLLGTVIPAGKGLRSLV